MAAGTFDSAGRLPDSTMCSRRTQRPTARAEVKAAHSRGPGGRSSGGDRAATASVPAHVVWIAGSYGVPNRWNRTGGAHHRYPAGTSRFPVTSVRRVS